MNSVEQAIRAALGKGDDSDQMFRRRIYASASAALERSLAARPYTEDEIGARRKSLGATIKHIESEYLVAVEAGAGAPVTPVVTAAYVAPAAAAAPVVRAESAIAVAPTKAPVPEALEQKSQAPAKNTVAAPDASERRATKTTAKPVKIESQRKPRPWFKYALNGGFLLAMFIGGLWAYAEGKRIYTEATSSNSGGAKPVLAEVSRTGENEASVWIPVFSANDTELVTAAQGAKAEITSVDGISVVTMTGDNTRELSIKIGAGLMQNFAGKKVLFNFKARSATGGILDTGAHCNFGAETKCERKRFKIGPEAAEYMFSVNVAAASTKDGQILIAPDLTGGNGALEIESIRASIVQPEAG